MSTNNTVLENMYEKLNAELTQIEKKFAPLDKEIADLGEQISKAKVKRQNLVAMKEKVCSGEALIELKNQVTSLRKTLKR